MAKKIKDLRRQKRRARLPVEEEIAIIEAQPDYSITRGVRPEGRAPRGKGKEFAARRWVANRVEAVERNASILRYNINRRRGQKRGRWTETHQRERLRRIRKALATSEKIIQGPGDWEFKKELVEGVLDTVKEPKN
jgi:hypothetical protein